MTHLTDYRPGESWRSRSSRERVAREALKPKRKPRPKATAERMAAWREEMRAKGYAVEG